MWAADARFKPEKKRGKRAVMMNDMGIHLRRWVDG